MRQIVREIKYQKRAAGSMTCKVLAHLPRRPARRGGLKAPTGGGKTNMTSMIINGVSDGCEGQVLFVFLTIGNGKLPQQAQDDLSKNLRGSGIKIHDIKSACDMFYPGMRNCVLVGGWEKLNHHDKKTGERTNIVMKTGTDNTSFIELCKQTNNDGIPIVLIIDEAHIASTTDISQDIIDIIDPSYILEVSATLNTKNLDDLETVRYSEAVDEEMVKDSIQIITFPEYHEGIRNGADQINKLIILAQEAGAKFSPKGLTFVPNDNDKSVELQEVLEIYRNEYGWTEESGDIKIVLSNYKTPGWEACKGKAGNSDTTKVFLTKMAISTGVDIPSISVITQMRPTNSKVVYLQQVGRGLRMPEHKHYKKKFANLNTLYYFVDGSLKLDFAETDDLEERQRFVSKVRSDIPVSTFIAMPGAYHDREKPVFEEDKATFDPLFRPPFLSRLQARDYFGFKWDRAHEFKVDLAVFDYDREQRIYLDTYKLSSNKDDITYIYDRKIYDVLKSHMYKHKGIIYDAVLEFMQTNVKDGLPVSEEYVKTFILNNLEEVIHPLVSESLKTASDTYDNQRERHEFEYIPPSEYVFFMDPKKVQEKKTTKCLYEPYYLDDPAKRSGDEDSFAEYLDKHESVLCWWKNYDRKDGSYSITYTGMDKDKTHYPDFIVMMKDGRVFVLEVKSGDNDKEAERKRDALINVLRLHKPPTTSGIVRLDTGWWYLDAGENGKKRMDDLFKLQEQVSNITKKYCGNCGNRIEGVCNNCVVTETNAV